MICLKRFATCAQWLTYHGPPGSSSPNKISPNPCGSQASSPPSARSGNCGRWRQGRESHHQPSPQQQTPSHTVTSYSSQHNTPTSVVRQYFKKYVFIELLLFYDKNTARHITYNKQALRIKVEAVASKVMNLKVYTQTYYVQQP